ncbi:peptidoglycan-binding protein [Streptomyces sp. NPDC005955]|uniref:peptidoglycan-binding protein n=1 Tax=Streptomyces sp. NPDC005955 TaxID=3364738 RepID=UPI0036CA239D
MTDTWTGQDPEGAAGTRTGRTRGVRGRPAGPGRRRTLLVVAAVVVVAVVAGAGAFGLDLGGDDEAATGPGRAGSVVEVARRTLVDQTAVDGKLGYGKEVPVPLKATGTVTWLPERGDRVSRGETLLKVDDRPVVLLYGALPMYRALGPGGTDSAGSASAGSDADGADAEGSGSEGSGDGKAGSGSGAGAEEGTKGMDVRQFESNLAALGYTDFTVDDEYTAKTAEAVKRWQRHLGVPRTGRITVGDVVYASGRIRVGDVGARIGAEATPEALSYTGGARRVTVDASAEDGAWATRGTEVTVELPGADPVDGKVSSVGRRMTAAEGDGGGEGGGAGQGPATFPVTITLDDPGALGRMESAPVTVRYVRERRAGVLSVPVSALVALAEGGHGLELAEPEGRFVAVRTGLFANGMVEVRGAGLREGLKVRIPE